VFGQRELAPVVAAIHAADLRDGDVAFVGEDDGVVGDVFEQRRGRFTGRAAGEVARVVLDPVADAGGLQHLEIEIRPLLQPLRLQQLALVDSCSSRWRSSALMPFTACCIVGRGVT
jgi:hypothetical protein